MAMFLQYIFFPHQINTLKNVGYEKTWKKKMKQNNL